MTIYSLPTSINSPVVGTQAITGALLSHKSNTSHNSKYWNTLTETIYKWPENYGLISFTDKYCKSNNLTSRVDGQLEEFLVMGPVIDLLFTLLDSLKITLSRWLISSRRTSWRWHSWRRWRRRLRWYARCSIFWLAWAWAYFRCAPRKLTHISTCKQQKKFQLYR